MTVSQPTSQLVFLTSSKISGFCLFPPGLPLNLGLGFRRVWKKLPSIVSSPPLPPARMQSPDSSCASSTGKHKETFPRVALEVPSLLVRESQKWVCCCRRYGLRVCVFSATFITTTKVKTWRRSRGPTPTSPAITPTVS